MAVCSTLLNCGEEAGVHALYRLFPSNGRKTWRQKHRVLGDHGREGANLFGSDGRIPIRHQLLNGLPVVKEGPGFAAYGIIVCHA